jgi:putative transposase
MIRTDAQLTVSRFCELIGLPRRTWYAWKAKDAAGLPVKGPWPTPVLDAIEPDVVKTAEAWPAWGHRKVWAMMRHDDHDVTVSSVRRVMARRGLLLPVRYQAERRELAKTRREVFWDEEPTRRNQVCELPPVSRTGWLWAWVGR